MQLFSAKVQAVPLFQVSKNFSGAHTVDYLLKVRLINKVLALLSPYKSEEKLLKGVTNITWLTLDFVLPSAF